ncbi:hypothetical protein SPHINGOT1_140093 [Sphingomonas sp. T1]|nr:hypothetical protein SPHINGOT1_140093 [Sphingomonas sp. T1]
MSLSRRAVTRRWNARNLRQARVPGLPLVIRY